MTLREEVALYQFGQGARAITEVLELFNPLDESEKWDRFTELYLDVAASAFINAAVAQALAQGLIQETDARYGYLHLDRLRTGLKTAALLVPGPGGLSEARFGAVLEVLLQLFKLDYRLCLAARPSHPKPISWWDADLSDAQVTQGILTRHEERVAQVYADVGYRCEFSSLARLGQADSRDGAHPPRAEADAAQTRFLTYAELVTESIKSLDAAQSDPQWLLRHSLNRALATRYRISAKEADWVLLEVLDRYLSAPTGSDGYP